MCDDDKLSHLFIGDEETPLRSVQSQSDYSADNDDASDESCQLLKPTDEVGNASERKQASCRRWPSGHLLLVFVAFMYGTLNVSLRLVYSFPDPPAASVLSMTRGWLAVVCFLPLLTRTQTQSIPEDNNQGKSLLRVALELGFWNFGAQGLLNLGLLSTESARASFLTQTSVVMTPVIAAIAGQSIHSKVWIGCIAALGGLIMLSDTGGVGISFSSGDLLVLLGALCWSFYLFRMSEFGGSFDEIRLQGSKTFILALLYTIWFSVAIMKGEEILWRGWANLAQWMLLFYSALGPGTIADIVQQKGQSKVSASVANIILSMEPVFTAVLGRLLLGEATSWQEKVGGGLIILASLVASL